MIKLFIGLITLIAMTSTFAQTVRPNQMCMGVNTSEEEVETKLFIGKKIDKSVSSARLVISLKGNERTELGTITNKPDLLGTRMFINKSDSLRYLTTGLLFDTDDVQFQLQMDCTQLRK